MLYWKFSPDTYYVSGAWCVMSVGILDNDGGVYYNSYGTDRRAHVVPVPAMYILSTRMVTSLATENITFQTIPTGEKSPSTDDYACYVFPSGNVDLDHFSSVYNSYGI